MLDAATTQKTSAIPHQRARGAARVAFSWRQGRTRLDRLHQSGSAKAMLPRTGKSMPELVFLNTAGGLTGGDRLEFSLTLGPGCAVTATTQTAERAYASLGASAQLDVDFRVGAGGVLHWLPQETILFDRATLARRTRIDLEGDARLLMAETLVLGRTAMGERIGSLDVTDRRGVYRDGRPIFIDPARLDCGFLDRRGNLALMGDALALATIFMTGDGCARHLPVLRRLFDTAEVEIAASAWEDKLVIRAMSNDAYRLRRVIAACLDLLTGAGLPRVWQI